MNSFKFDAFCGEFPFLLKIGFDSRKPEGISIQVARMSVELFGVCASQSSYDWGEGSRASGNRLFLVYADGGIDELPQGGDRLSARKHDPQYRDIPSPTLLEYLDPNTELSAIVEKNYDYCTWEGRDEGLNIVVYKSSPKVDVKALVEQARAKAARDVAAEIKVALEG